MPKGQSEEQRFWEKVVIGSDDECWLWGAAIDPDGYGWFTRTGKRHEATTTTAHRYSALLKYKDIGDNLVRHTCDNRACVNPAHLILGSPADNSKDMIERNRQARGEKQHQANLSDVDALAVLATYKVAKDSGELYGCLEQLAKHYGVSKQCIYRITSRQSYKHLII